MKFSKRMSRLGTESAFEVLARARALEAQGKEIIHLELGEPDFETPKHISDATVKALRDGHTRYGPAPGMLEFRQVIAENVSRSRGIDVRPEHVVVTPGGKPIMFFAILALVDEGDEVIYPDPGFPIYESMIRFVGAKAVPLPLREEKDFGFDTDELAKLITSKTRMIIINSPENPTGGVLSRRDLEGIADLTRGKEITILSDEVYESILYEGKHESIASLPKMQEQTVILNSFSKTYSMGGWRLGYGVMPVTLAEELTKLQINSTSCPNDFIQYGGIAALTSHQQNSVLMVQEFKRRRDILVNGLNKIDGITCLCPRGAFFVFPNVTKLERRTQMNTNRLADYLLERAGVAVIPGTAFGKYGKNHLRISYSNSEKNIQKALANIKACL